MIKILFLLLSINIIGQDFEIKSLKTYKSGDEISFPVIDYNSEKSPKITIEFDIAADYQPFLNIVFKFCDKNWQPYDNIFLVNQGHNVERNLWFDKLPNNIRGASYHFKKNFPSQDVWFPFSGKWIYYITDNHDESIIYASGKFLVVYPGIKINASMQKSRLEGENANSSTRTFTLSADFILPDSLNTSYVDEIEIIENQKFYDPIIITRDPYNNYRYYNWDGANRFSFVAKDIFPGNEYRQVDLRDYNIFNSKKVNAHRDVIETAQTNSRYYRDFNGGSILTNYKSEYADYLDVTFKLRMPSNFKKKIFLIGSFNEWDVWYDYEMQNNGGLYELTAELKRGIYDYQYVTAEEINGSITNLSWIELEGNNWETNNEYHVLLYYKEPERGNYDRLLGYVKILSGGL